MKAILFDLDGTLVDSLADLANAMNYVLRSNQLPEHPIDIYRTFVGNGIRKLVERALPEEQRKNIDSYHKQMLEYYGKHCCDQTIPYNGIPELLETAKAKNYRLAVLSNKANEFTQRIIQHLFSAATFDIVRGAIDRIPLKPDPTAATLIAKELGVDAKHIFYLGDTNIDMQTAINATMHSVGCTWGFRTEAELRQAGAELILHHPTDLIDIL